MHGHTYSFEPITPLTLLPLTTYDIVADVIATDGLAQLASPVVNVPDIIFGTGRSEIASLGSFPTGDSFMRGPYFGPTFEVGAAPTAVPEPSSFALLALGGGALAGWRRWRKRRTA
jgi:hypothetical protein